MDQFTTHIERCLSSQVYRTRDLAARASVSFIQTEKILLRFEKIFSNVYHHPTDSNEVHGQLLQVRMI